VEVEVKFRVSDAVLLERLAAAPRLVGYDLEAPALRRDVDAFLDTADGRLLAAGFYLRRRENAEGVRMALKQIAAAEADGVLRREEHELRVAADVPVADWPRGPLKTRVRGLVGDEDLTSILVLEQERRTRRVGLEGRAVAELSLDAVVVRTGRRARRWYEAEVELLADGTEGDLAELSAALRDVWGLVPELRSKFERARELTGQADGAAGAARAARRAAGPVEDVAEAPAPGETAVVEPAGAPETAGEDARSAGEAVASEPAGWTPGAAEARRKRPPVSREDTMIEAAVAVMRLHFAKMLAHEAGTRAGDDPEELHDMRVATRRLRMAVRLFEGFLDAEAMRPALKGLRRTGRALGAVRDLDVFREKTQRYVDGLPAARRDELAPLLDAWTEEYETRREAMLKYLDGPRYRGFVKAFAAVLAGPPQSLSGRDGGGAKVRQVLPALLHRDLADVLAAGSLVDGADTPLTRFHELRIAGKALRYTLEFFEVPLGRGAVPLIDAMKTLQDHLGDLQDAVVSCGIVRDVLTWGSWAPPAAGRPTHTDIVLAPGLARYLASRQEEMERLTASFAEVWPQVAGEEFGGRLAALLARL
jgi:CHAD domain-containing protein